jgi:hypothetical protein
MKAIKSDFISEAGIFVPIFPPSFSANHVTPAGPQNEIPEKVRIVSRSKSDKYRAEPRGFWAGGYGTKVHRSNGH